MSAGCALSSAPIAEAPRVGLEQKIAFLRRPASYPEAPPAVEAIETHMSWVFLTRERVYKLKKPVRYDFLDFGTVELRRRNCRREVRLNRRLAPGVYLGVVALVADTEGRLRLGGGASSGRVVDWLVEMRRLPAAAMLDRKIEDGTVTAAEIHGLGLLLGRFYQGLAPVAMSARSYRERFRHDIDVSYDELAAPAASMPRARVAAVRDALVELVDRHRELLDRRVRERRIVEAHGDLRPEHVCFETPPVVIDCLEFERTFRLLDPADELAYLALECERLGAAWIGPELFAAYAEVTEDRPDPALVTFYTAFRSYLRGRIAILHLKEPVDHRRWIARAERYLELAAAKLGC
jgi:aminoglycoside phosphotransferase family enzyme